MSTVLAKIDQAFLSTILAKITVGVEKNWSGKIGLERWSVTVKFTITNMRGAIENDRVKVFAKVHVQAGPISYTDDVEAEAEIGMDDTQMVLRVKSLLVSLYVAPLGHRTDLGNVDICSLLPNPIEARFKVFPDFYTASLPASMEGAPVTITASKPQVMVRAGTIEASVVIGAS